MNAQATAFVPTVAVESIAQTGGAEASTFEKRHRRLVRLVSLVAIGALIALMLYGADYYRLSQADRAFSSKHHLLRPGGLVGINLGLLGVLMLCGIFLYPLRKRWGWLRKQGRSKHWLDHHVVLGVAAPVCIAFHASFKFHGLAGMAFWVMVAVSLSGLIGRYLYAQIPREVVVAETSLIVLQRALQSQTIVPQADLQRLLLHSPAASRVSRWSPFTALAYIAACDFTRPFRVARLRLKILGIKATISSMAGLQRPNKLSSKTREFEEVISLACMQALICRRAKFLFHARRVFEFWHVVHKPFSYAFVVLALIHIGVAMLLGFI